MSNQTRVEERAFKYRCQISQRHGVEVGHIQKDRVVVFFKLEAGINDYKTDLSEVGLEDYPLLGTSEDRLSKDGYYNIYAKKSFVITAVANADGVLDTTGYEAITEADLATSSDALVVTHAPLLKEIFRQGKFSIGGNDGDYVQNAPVGCKGETNDKGFDEAYSEWATFHGCNNTPMVVNIPEEIDTSTLPASAGDPIPAETECLLLGIEFCVLCTPKSCVVIPGAARPNCQKNCTCDDSGDNAAANALTPQHTYYPVYKSA